MVRILIVDDDLPTLRLVKLALEKYGYSSIKIAGNGYRALEIFYDIDLVIMDYKMPVLNGIETMELMLERNKLCEFIFMSADFLIKEHLKGYQVFGILEKPFELENLFSLLKKFEMEKIKNKNYVTT